MKQGNTNQVPGGPEGADRVVIKATSGSPTPAGGVAVPPASGPPRNVGEHSEPECSGGPEAGARKIFPPDPEVPAKSARRRFSAKYKLDVLGEIDACTKLGQTGAILRREGLYSSHIATWREQRRKGLLAALAPKKRGPKPTPENPFAKENVRLVLENRALQKKLRKAETIIDFQKKLSEILGISMGDESSS